MTLPDDPIIDTAGSMAFELEAIFKLAKALIQARGFIPQHLKTEGEIAAVILAGRELGLPPMTSIRSVLLVSGKVSLDASMQLALLKRAGIKHTWIADGSDRKVAKLRLERQGDAPHEQTYTIDDAKAAGLAGGATWTKHTPAMLRARCVSAAAKAYAPDVLSGVYVPDEIAEIRGDYAPAATQTQASTQAHEQSNEPIAEPDQQPASDPAQDIASLVSVDLPACATRGQLVIWARELIRVNAPGKAKLDAWKAFQTRCEERQLSPSELVAEAKK